ncbi:MAG: hypothetical protein GWP10_06730 [Nitrospiraceae bacterium]|nr:hypothetical protein [Nitrospiraceae bacterium]
MKRNRVCIWLDVDDEIEKLKQRKPKERGKLIRKALKAYFNENALIVGKAVLEQLQNAFPDVNVDDDLVVKILTSGIRKVREKQEELELEGL